MPGTISLERSTSVPPFDSIEDLRTGLDAKKRFIPIDLYPRDGTRLLGEIEARVAELNGLPYGHALVYTTGMAAVSSAVMVALAESKKPSLAYAGGMYNKTIELVEKDISPFVDTYKFDSGDPASWQAVLETHKPSVILAEPVANSRDMPVLDIEALLAVTREMPDPPTIVIDKTFPLSTAQPLAEKIDADSRVIFAYSGTKSYAFNNETLGIAYSRHPGLLQALREHRRRQGSTVGVASQSYIHELLPPDRETFDERNLSIFSNTGHLALRVADAVDSLGLDHIRVSHPGLPSNRNHQLYRRLYPNEGSPVFFLHSSSIGRWDLAKQLAHHPDVAAHSAISQSFGFDTARVLVDESAQAVRIAGGAYTDVAALGDAFAKALSTL